MGFELKSADARHRVEAELHRRLGEDPAVPQRLRQAMLDAAVGGGKRFRPFLVFESARLFDADLNAALTVAAALEAVHCYSLVHDDLPAMDNDAMRRGRPTVWKAYDEWTAILAGDGLLTLAFQWLAEAGSGISPDLLPRIIFELARAAGPAGMVGGQAMDLDADKRGIPAVPSLDHVRRLQALKTGALIRFACRAGPVLAGRSDADISAMTVYGEALGLAFQISDDLLDATGDALLVGKAVAKDAAAGKATLLSLYGIEGARDVLAATTAQAKGALQPYGTRAAVLVEAIDFMAIRTK